VTPRDPSLSLAETTPEIRRRRKFAAAGNSPPADMARHRIFAIAGPSFPRLAATDAAHRR
jgi:hypothetical protein